MQRFLVTLAVALFSVPSVSLAQHLDVEALAKIVAAQGKVIEQLRQELDDVKQRVGRETVAFRAEDNGCDLATVVPLAASLAPTAGGMSSSPTPGPLPAQAGETAPAGFRFSGDFRFRLDAAVRGSGPGTPGVQNVRGRYRLRLNAQRDISRDLSFHGQLSTGAVNNGITFDQDFAGGVTRHPFFISEAYIDYHPSPRLTIRGGKLPEAFADNSRFLWDDDVRFNGLEQRIKIGKVELRAGQYFFVNPNVFSVSNVSPLVQAGLEPGAIARASQMYHPGVIYDSRLNANWKHTTTVDMQLYRNPSLIALTSNANGAAATVSPAIGLSVSAPAPGVGNATTSPTNAVLFARHYQVVRASYRLDATQLGGNARLPFTWIAQVSRNVGTAQLRDAVLTSVSLGRTSQAGDVRGQYAFAIKDANSLISQLTDDDLATGIGVNIATHHFRVDYTVRPNISLQNLLFLQTSRRSSNPAAGFFVPLGRETPRTWRYQGQLAITF